MLLMCPDYSSTSYVRVSAIGQLPFPFLLSGQVIPPDVSAVLHVVTDPDPGPSFTTTFSEHSGTPGTYFYSSSIVPMPMSSAADIEAPLSCSMVGRAPPSSIGLATFSDELFPVYVVHSLSIGAVTSYPIFASGSDPLFATANVGSISDIYIVTRVQRNSEQNYSLPLSEQGGSDGILDVSHVQSRSYDVF